MNDPSQESPERLNSGIGLNARRDATQFSMGGSNIGRDHLDRPTFHYYGGSRATHNTLVALHQLPPDIRDFSGRVDETGRLLTWWADSKAQTAHSAVVLSISGAAGVGKSALALHFAHHIVSDFPDGQFYINLRGPEREKLRPSEVPTSFLRALGLPVDLIPESLTEQTALYRSLLERKRMLIMLDNAFEESQVRPIIPAASECLVVVTSRSPLTALEGSKLFALKVLEPEQAIELFATIAGRDALSAESRAAERVVELCGYLPLAIRIAAAKLRAQSTASVTRLAERLTKRSERLLDELREGDLEVRASFDLSYATLRDQGKRTFRLLGLLTSKDFSVEVAGALAGVNIYEAEDILEYLLRAQVLEVDTNTNRYRFHDLIREFARERLTTEESPGRQKGALERVLMWYMERIDEARVLIGPKGGPVSANPTLTDIQAALEWFETEHSDVVKAVEQAYSVGLLSECWTLSLLASRLFEAFSYWAEWQSVAEIGLQAAERSGDVIAKGRMLGSLGSIYRQLNQWERSIDVLNQALLIFEEAGSSRDLAITLEHVGLWHMTVGELDKALEFFERAGQEEAPETLLNNIGVAYQRLGRPIESISYLERSLEAAIREEDGRGEAVSRVSLGLVYLDLERWHDAEACLQQARAIFRERRDSHREAQTLIHLGRVYAKQGRKREAVEVYEEGLAVFDSAGDVYWRARVLLELGTLANAMGDQESAMANWREATAILELLRAPELGRARTLLQEHS